MSKFCLILMRKNFEFNISKNEKIISAMSNLLVKVFARRKLFFKYTI